MRTPLKHTVEHDGAGGLRESGELAQRVLGILLGALRIHTDEHDVLEPQLTVLDLGDVLEFGRETGDTAQGVPILQIPLGAVGRAVRSGGCVLQRLSAAEDEHIGALVGVREHAVDGVAIGRGCGIRHPFLISGFRFEP